MGKINGPLMTLLANIRLLKKLAWDRYSALFCPTVSGEEKVYLTFATNMTFFFVNDIVWVRYVPLFITLLTHIGQLKKLACNKFCLFLCGEEISFQKLTIGTNKTFSSSQT